MFQGIYHSQNTPLGVHTCPDKPLFPLGCGIFLGHKIIIIKYCCGIGKVNAVLLLIIRCLGRVPGDPHKYIVHELYIHSEELSEGGRNFSTTSEVGV